MQALPSARFFAGVGDEEPIGLIILPQSPPGMVHPIRGKIPKKPIEYEASLCCPRAMKKNLRYWAVAAVGAAAALGFTSCAYDPYYQSSVGGSYSSGGGGGSYGGGGGYGDGYGYGGSSFSTSLFVGTGNSQWGYDPGCRSYYDYGRNCYYDPYLNGYYPRGYRPPVVYGAPHPHGWTSGRDYIRPPGRVSGGYVSDYRNRESRYRNSDYGWARQVRRGPGEEEDRNERSGRQGFQRLERQGYQGSERQESRRSGRSEYQESGMSAFGGGRTSSPLRQVQRQPSQRELAQAYQESIPQRARQDAQRSSRFEGMERGVTREVEQGGGGGRQAASYDRREESSGSESRGQRSAPRAERNSEQPQSEGTPARARAGRRAGREEESR